LTNRNYYYIVVAMKNEFNKISESEIDEKTAWFVKHCRDKGLKITPQRLAIYSQLLRSGKHPSAEMLYKKIKGRFPNISLDTVNRTLMTLSEIGAAFIVEGSGDARRFDADTSEHQHFRCVKCRRVIDFHHRPFDDLKLPDELSSKFTVLRKTVYVEGICDRCR
jgi:Fur family transcriptional regulator, peroxide stress response regulator